MRVVDRLQSSLSVIVRFNLHGFGLHAGEALNLTVCSYITMAPSERHRACRLRKQCACWLEMGRVESGRVGGRRLRSAMNGTRSLPIPFVLFVVVPILNLVGADRGRQSIPSRPRLVLSLAKGTRAATAALASLTNHPLCYRPLSRSELAVGLLRWPNQPWSPNARPPRNPCMHRELRLSDTGGNC